MNSLLMKACFLNLHQSSIRSSFRFAPKFCLNVLNCNYGQQRLNFRTATTATPLLSTSNYRNGHHLKRSNSRGQFVISELQYIQRRNAGHSKWANIKHQKSLADQKKALEFDKHIRAMRAAAKENKSPDPKVNKKLADAIERAKAAKVPTATIQRALENLARGFSKAGDFKQLNYIMKGPGGCVVIALLETDHVNKLKMDLSGILRKHGFTVGTDSMLHMFDQKGIILCTGVNGKSLTEEQLDECVEHAIEAGAEEVHWTDSPLYGSVMQFTSQPQDFFQVVKNLENMNYEIVYSEVDYLPKHVVELDNEQLELVSKFHQKLQDQADVVKIYDNIA